MKSSNTFGALWRKFQAFAAFMNTFLMSFGVLLLCGMFGLFLYVTIVDWTGGTASERSEEILRYILPWSVLIVMGPVIRSNNHIKTAFLPQMLLGEKRSAVFVYVMENMIGLALCIYLAIHAYRLMVLAPHFGPAVHPVPLRFLHWWFFHSFLFFGFCFSAFYYFERTVRWTRSLFTRDDVVVAPQANFRWQLSI